MSGCNGVRAKKRKQACLRTHVKERESEGERKEHCICTLAHQWLPLFCGLCGERRPVNHGGSSVQ